MTLHRILLKPEGLDDIVGISAPHMQFNEQSYFGTDAYVIMQRVKYMEEIRNRSGGYSSKHGING